MYNSEYVPVLLPSLSVPEGVNDPRLFSLLVSSQDGALGAGGGSSEYWDSSQQPGLPVVSMSRVWVYVCANACTCAERDWD